MESNPNQVFIREKNLKPISYPVEFVDAIFPFYKHNKGGRKNTPSFLSTEDLLKW